MSPIWGLPTIINGKFADINIGIYAKQPEYQ
jgi:hypothetical protein